MCSSIELSEKQQNSQVLRPLDMFRSGLNMTEPSLVSLQVPKNPQLSRNMIVAVVVGLVIGLALGIFISVLLDLPSSFHTAAGTNNQVQVSGTVSLKQTGHIEFETLNSQARLPLLSAVDTASCL
jgi:capsular polysaccharide biosynthesis protein